MSRLIIIVALASALSMWGCGGGEGNSGVLPGVQALVFVKRAFVREDGSHEVASGMDRVMDYERYVPGGGLYVLEPPTPDGELRNLTEDFAGVDINGISLSFDARQVAFSMRTADSDHYHLYIANIDGSSPPRQLTFGAQDDIQPIFVPGDRLVFVTNEAYTAMGTRREEYERSDATQIASISITAGDGDRRLCSQNLSHVVGPTLLSDGTIAFSRWEHLGPVNDLKLFRMNPDCTQMVAVAGQHGKPSNSLVQTVETRPGVFVAVATSRDGTIQAGSLVQIDARATTGPEAIAFDEENARYEVITPAVPTDEESPASGVGRYRSPAPIPGSDNLLVSWANGDVNDRNELAGTAPNYGIYMFDPATQRRTLVYDDPGAWDVYALAVVPRETIPPVHPGTVAPAPDPTTPAVIGSVDVTQTSLEETIVGGQFGSEGIPLRDALQQTTRVRVIEGFSGEIGGVNMFGLTMHEGAAILGEVPVYADGSWEAEVAPFIPYHLQPIDRYGLSIRNQMLWIQAMPGESRRCGGCHERRTSTILPRTGATTLAQQAGPVALNIPIPERQELPWYGATSTRNIQDLFDTHCTSCHSGGATDPFAGRFYTVNVTTEEGEMLTYQIPYLDLSSRPINAYYEMETVTYPASYVSLLYPSAMMGDSEAIGDVPPMWVVPGAARESVAIAKVNAQAEDDAAAWAWPTMAHPEDVGVTLTREERMMLIQMADLGGQYWSRRNVEGSDRWGSVEY